MAHLIAILGDRIGAQLSKAVACQVGSPRNTAMVLDNDWPCTVFMIMGCLRGKLNQVHEERWCPHLKISCWARKATGTDYMQIKKGQRRPK